MYVSSREGVVVEWTNVPCLVSVSVCALTKQYVLIMYYHWPPLPSPSSPPLPFPPLLFPCLFPFPSPSLPCINKGSTSAVRGPERERSSDCSQGRKGEAKQRAGEGVPVDRGGGEERETATLSSTCPLLAYFVEEWCAIHTTAYCPL